MMHNQRKKRCIAPSGTSERLFRPLVEEVQDYAIFMLDREGYVLTWNAGLERNKGYKAEEIIGRHYSSFFTPAAIAKGIPANQLLQARLVGHFQEEGWRVRKDGSSFWADVTLSAMYSEEDGRLIGFAKVTRDLTERRQREEALRSAKETAESANRAKSAFLANMSHELYTPLNAIIGFSDIMQSEMFGPIGNAQYHSYVKDIFNSGRHLLGLINDILDLTKLDAGFGDLHDEAVDLAEFAAESFPFLTPFAQATQIKLTADLNQPE